MNAQTEVQRKIEIQIGQLVVANIALTTEIEALRREIEALKYEKSETGKSERSYEEETVKSK